MSFVSALLVSTLTAAARSGRRGDYISAAVSRPIGAARNLADSRNFEEYVNVYEERLEDACFIQDVNSFFENNFGTLCHLKATVLGRQEVQRYTFSLTEAAASLLNLQLVLTELRGSARITIKMLSYPEHAQEEDAYWSTVSLEEYMSDESLIFVPRSSFTAAIYAIEVEALTATTIFSLRAELMRGDVIADRLDGVLLDEVRLACCSGVSNCTGVLAHVADGYTGENELCTNVAGVHCDSTGSITHLDLSQSRMSCSLDSLTPLAEFSSLQMLQLGDNDITGDIANSAFLSSFPSLAYLNLNNLPGITGSLPELCTPPFDFIFHLGISNTSISGTVPDCLLRNIVQLEMSNTRMTGTFPNLPVASRLRTLIVDALEGAETTFSGPMPDLSNAQDLKYASFLNHRFTGSLAVPASIEVALFGGNALTGIELPSTLDNLQALDLYGNSIAGPVPNALAQAENLVLLDLAANAFDTMPNKWAFSRLHELRLEDNVLQGTLPPSLSESNHLRVLDLRNNSLSGTIESFAVRLLTASRSGLVSVNLADNDFTGGIYLEYLITLAVFTSGSEVLPGGDQSSITPHVLDLSNNDLKGIVHVDVLEAIAQQIRDGVHLTVDLQGNSITCPDDEEFVELSLREEWREYLGCFGSATDSSAAAAPSPSHGSPSRVRTALITTFTLAFAALVLTGSLLLYRQYRQRITLDGDRTFAAQTYVSQATGGSSSTTRNGSSRLYPPPLRSQTSSF